MYSSWEGSLDETVGEAFDIFTLNVQSCDDLTRGAFELYKETCALVNLAASFYVGEDPTDYPLSRNEAIAVGLLVRLSKFMLVVTQLSADGSVNGGAIIDHKAARERRFVAVEK